MQPKRCRVKKSTKELASTVEFLKVIAEENRIKILCMLRAGEKCVCEIWQALDLPQNLASHHLKILKDSKLIGSRKEGLKVYYSINKREVSGHCSSLNGFLESYGR